MFFEGLKDLHKTFCGTKKKSENIFFIYFFIFFPSFRIGTGSDTDLAYCSLLPEILQSIKMTAVTMMVLFDLELLILLELLSL